VAERARISPTHGRRFESARHPDGLGARPSGVAQAAMEAGRWTYGEQRQQFWRARSSISRAFADKIAMMAVEGHGSRAQLTYFAARQERIRASRCDLEAGMAKLLAARIAWANADKRRTDPRRQRVFAASNFRSRAILLRRPPHSSAFSRGRAERSRRR